MDLFHSLKLGAFSKRYVLAVIFVAQNVRYDLPEPLADHLALTWDEETPFEPDPIVIYPSGVVMRLSGAGGWFVGRVGDRLRRR